MSEREDVGGLPAQSAGGSSADASPHRPEARGFTPGPWHIGSSAGEMVIVAGQSFIAYLARWAFPLQPKKYNGPYSSDQMLANARLIAAAPQLYEALVALVGAIAEAPTHFSSRRSWSDVAFSNAYDALRAAGEAIPQRAQHLTPEGRANDQSSVPSERAEEER